MDVESTPPQSATTEGTGLSLTKGCADLDTLLQAHPHAGQEILEILGKRLTGTFDPQTYQILYNGLINLLSPDAIWVIAYAAQSARGEWAQELGEYASPRVMGFVRAVIGLYGPELDRAYALWNEYPHNWRTFLRDVYYDYVNQRYYLRIRLLKYNGEETVVEGNPDSMLQLASYLLKTLRMVESPDVYTQGIRDQFLEEVKEFLTLLGVIEKEQQGDQPDQNGKNAVIPPLGPGKD
jgi:hypothetical protein